MKAESDPITDDEWLLRRVRAERFRTEKTPLISPNAFEPRIKGQFPDTDGISLYRAACLSVPEQILHAIPSEQRPAYGIVRVQVRLLLQLGLSVRIAPDDSAPGHVVIPELNAKNYSADKARYKPLMLEIAKHASQEGNIVLRPAEHAE